jgi:hypothetical protein
MRPTLSHEARQALFRAAHAECSVLMAAMLKRLVLFLLLPIRSKPKKQERRRSANVHPLYTAITQGAVR